MKLVPENINSVTVIKLDHIGDVILATPVLESLRNGFPKAIIRVVVGSWSKDVLKNNPNVDEVLCFNPPWLDRSLKCNGEGKREENKETLRSLLGVRHDLVIDLRRNDYHHLLFSASLANEHLLAYKTNSEYDQLITKGVSVSNRDHTAIQQNKLLKCIGLRTAKSPQLYPSKEDIEWAKKELSSNKPKIAIFTGAGAVIKKWSENNFIKLGNRLHNLGFNLVVVGGEQECALGKKLASRCKAQNFCGKTSLLQLASVLKHVDLLVSNDSAPVHIASSVDTPVIVITKPNAILEFAPSGAHDFTISRNHCEWHLNCPGFVFPKSSLLPQYCRCIQSITVEEVERVIYRTFLSFG